ncbi:MAG TPA: site-2 protease family protein [Methylomirabilota bacterium]|nr:site-2 protease family protein [Methylomirabilota bacterium]
MAARPGLRIGRILGIPIYLHASWIVIFVLITLSLATQYKQEHPHWSELQHWTAGILTSLLFFGSVVFHELMHSAVARRYKIPVRSITLFVFGGLARIEREASSPMQEFNIAVAGPLASFFLAGVFWSLTKLLPYHEMVGAQASWLAYINFSLAVFNLIPGFPLDGGRLFRAIVWSVTKSYSRATRIAGAVGKLFAYTLILGGLWLLLMRGQWANGVWLAFIGWFLLTAAQESVAQVAIHDALSGLHASDVMSHEIPAVPRDISLEEYGAEVLRTGRRCHLVLQDGRLLGMVSVHTLNSVGREEWAHNSVQSVMIPREKVLSASPEEPLQGVLERLLGADVNQMPVIAGSGDGSSRIVGMLSRDSILQVIQARTLLGRLTAG